MKINLFKQARNMVVFNFKFLQANFRGQKGGNFMVGHGRHFASLRNCCRSWLRHNITLELIKVMQTWNLHWPIHDAHNYRNRVRGIKYKKVVQPCCCIFTTLIQGETMFLHLLWVPAIQYLHCLLTTLAIFTFTSLAVASVTWSTK